MWMETRFGQSVKRLQSNMNYLTNSYKNNDDLNEPNPSNLLVENTAARRKSSRYCSSYKDPFKGDKDCLPSLCFSSIQGLSELENDSAEMVLRVLEDGSDSRSSLKRSHNNSGDDIGLKKQRPLAPV
ncbi:hypothetical protein CBL_09951 [Carabus blaptoides fortunei]